MYGSVSSAIATERTDCCMLYQGVSAPASKMGVAVASWSSVVEDPVSEAEQAVTVEHESVIVDVDSVLAPEGVKTEYDVSQALAVCVEQELLELLDLESVFVEEAELVGWLVGSVESYVGSPAESNVIDGIFDEKPGGGLTPGGGGGKMPGPRPFISLVF